jgi:hypothetical protein
LYAFSRNPYDRVVSCFFYLKQGGRNAVDRRDRQKYVGSATFQQFVIHALRYASEGQTHLRPQTHWIPDGVDFLGRVESFQEDFDRLCDVLGRKRVRLPHENKTKHGYYKKYYTPAMAKVVEKVYVKDFETLGYETDNFF